jgi:hypothetical protein
MFLHGEERFKIVEFYFWQPLSYVADDVRMPRFGDSVTASPLASMPKGGSAKTTLSFFCVGAMFFLFTER